MSLDLSGLNSLAYLGVLPSNPPKVVVVSKIPGTNDRNNFSIGDLWVVKNMNQIWILVSLAQSRAVWANLFPGGGGALIFDTEDGVATPAAGELNIFGDPNIPTTGSGNTVTFELSNGSNGQLLIGGGADAAWHSLTSTGGSVTYTTGANTLNLEATSFSGFTNSFVTDDSHTVTPANHIVNIFSGANINTSGSGSTVTINLDNDIIIPGTITVNSLNAGVVQSSSSGLLSSNYGSNGQLLVGSNSAAPAWANITSNGGTVTITNTPNNINLEVTTPGVGTAGNQFMALQTTNLNAVVGNINTFYSLGTSAALSEAFDVGGNLFPGSGTGSPAVFTAPSTGAYYLCMCVNVNIMGGGGDTIGNWIIVTSNRTYYMKFRPGFLFEPSGSFPSQGVISTHVIADMDMGDTATFQVNIGKVTPNANIHGIFNNLTYVCGFSIGA